MVSLVDNQSLQQSYNEIESLILIIICTTEATDDQTPSRHLLMVLGAIFHRKSVIKQIEGKVIQLKEEFCASCQSTFDLLIGDKVDPNIIILCSYELPACMHVSLKKGTLSPTVSQRGESMHIDHE